MLLADSWWRRGKGNEMFTKEEFFLGKLTDFFWRLSLNLEK